MLGKTTRKTALQVDVDDSLYLEPYHIMENG